MAKKYTLKYKTFDSLLADVMVDFRTFNQENMIEPQDLIRVAKWVTKDLGLKIYKTKEVILELHYGKAKLPDDFYVFNYGLLCGEYSVKSVLPQGTTMKEMPYPAPVYQSQQNIISTCDDGVICPSDQKIENCESACDTGIVNVPGYNPLQPYGDPCVKPRVFMDCKNNAFELIQILSTETRIYKYMLSLRLSEKSSMIDCYCPNLKIKCADEIWIEDGFIHSNLKSASVYINYEGALEDENGNLLIVDHEKLILYYEYKLKDRILENLFISGEDVERILDRNAMRLRIARIEAKNLVNMPELDDLALAWKLNRQAYNARFVNMFRTSNWYGGIW